MKHCGSDNSAIVSKSAKGIGFSCFRCGASEFEPFGIRSVAEVLEQRAALENLTQTFTKIPDNAVALADPSVPSAARVWVLKAGITPELATEKYGFKWHEQTRRVFIPVADDTVYARAIDKGDLPKYKVLGRMSSHLFCLPGESPTVIAEDVLSAIKINSTGYKAYAVLGTSLTPDLAYRLATENDQIILWLDPDKGGDTGRRRIKKALGLYPVEIFVARLDEKSARADPKYLSKDEIKKVVEETMTNGG